MTGKRRVLITGTTRGIGLGLMEAFAARGDEVIAVDRRRDDSITVRFSGVDFHTIDITDHDAVNAFILSLEKEGRLPDVVIFNAALHDTDNEMFLDFEKFQSVIEVNMSSVFFFLSVLMPKIKSPAVFTFISSGVIIFPNPSCLGYYISKLGVTKAFDHFSYRHANRGFLFKSVILGPIATDLLADSKRPSGFVGVIRDMTTGTVDELAPKIVRFIDGPGRRMYYKKSSALILWLARMAQRLLPQRLKVYQAKPSAGNAGQDK